MVSIIGTGVERCPVPETPLAQIDEKTKKRMAVVHQTLAKGFKEIERREAIALAEAKSLKHYK